MIKKICAGLLALCLAVLIVAPVYAQSNITVQSTSVEAKFPTGITFNITARSTSPVTELRLHYTLEQIGFAEVSAEAFVEFTPSASVSASWTWDMRRSGGLPPGTIISYWWTVRDSSGGLLDTPPAQVRFDDTRFKWQKITGGKINIYWYEGTASFAQDLLSTAQEATDRLQRDTGAFLKENVSIYIYASSTDLRGSMIFPQEWTGGVAFTREGTIAIGISPLNLAWGKRAIAHELTHLVTHQMVLNPYNSIPVWLEEGIAMYNEGPLLPEFSTPLKKAVTDNKLLSLQTLSSPFSAYADISYLSYAESQSAVDYLIKTYGKDKMLELLETFRQGNTYDGALMKVYGLNTKSLNVKWKQSLGAVPKTSRKVPFPTPILILVTLPGIVGLCLSWRRHGW
jgi:hypothetical protein